MSVQLLPHGSIQQTCYTCVAGESHGGAARTAQLHTCTAPWGLRSSTVGRAAAAGACLLHGAACVPVHCLDMCALFVERHLRSMSDTFDRAMIGLGCICSQRSLTIFSTMLDHALNVLNHSCASSCLPSLFEPLLEQSLNPHHCSVHTCLCFVSQRWQADAKLTFPLFAGVEHFEVDPHRPLRPTNTTIVLDEFAAWVRSYSCLCVQLCTEGLV